MGMICGIFGGSQQQNLIFFTFSSIQVINGTDLFGYVFYNHLSLPIKSRGGAILYPLLHMEVFHLQRNEVRYPLVFALNAVVLFASGVSLAAYVCNCSFFF